MRTWRRRAAWAAGMACVALVAGATPARAQPPQTPESYLLLGLSRIDVSNSISAVSGSIGVNDKSPGKLTGNGRVDFAGGVIAADKVTLPQGSMCQALFADQASGSGLCATPEPVSLPLVPNLTATDVCRLPKPFPSCNSAKPVTVTAGDTRLLAPGTYGDLTVAGTLQLQGGPDTYVFCNVTTNNGSVITAMQPSTLLVEDRVKINPNSLVNVDGEPGALRILVSGKGVDIKGSDTLLGFSATAVAGVAAGVSQATCRFGRRLGRSASILTTVVAQICAPRQNAQMNLSTANLIGTFVADAIGVGNIQGAIAPPTTTTTLPTTTTSTTSTTTTTSTTSTTTSTTSTTTSTTTTSTTTTTTSTTSTTTTTTSTTTTVPTTTTTTTASTTTTATAPTTTTTAPTTTTTAPPTTTTTTSTTTTITAPPTTTPTTTAPPTSTTSTPASTSTSTSTTPPTSTTLPPVCDNLQVTSITFKPRKRNPAKSRLVIRGVLADSGWGDVDPQRANVNVGTILRGADPSCCTIDEQFWLKLFPTRYGFWDPLQRICPPIVDSTLIVRRNGSAGFVVVARGSDATEEMLTEMALGVVVGGHCSVGTLSIDHLRRRGQTLVWP
jgi:hypothetical protein